MSKVWVSDLKVANRLIEGVFVLGFTEFGNRVTYSGVVDNEFALTPGKFAAHQYFPDVEHLKSLIVTPWQPMKRMPDRDELIAQFGDNNYPKVTLQAKDTECHHHAA